MKGFIQLLVFMICFAHVSMAQRAKYVVVISIDGFRPDFYKEASWATPNLQQMKNNGVYADGVNSVFPSVTYPSHTTIITGVLPAKHGIYCNEPFEPDITTGRWNWEADLIKSPTLWQAVHKAGLTSAAVSWPVTVGASIDYNVPEIWTLGKNADNVKLRRENTTPKGLFEEIEKNTTGKLTSDDFNADYLSMDENIARIGAYIIKTYKPNLTAIHFVCVDHFEHSEGRDGPMVRKAVEQADCGVGRILEALKAAGILDSTAIIVTGDHGFVDIHTALCPNVWLAQNGLISTVNGKRAWKAIFQTSGASAFLHLADNNDRKTLDSVKNILDNLPSSIKKMFRVINKSELEKSGSDPNAFLALSPIQGVSMNGSTDGPDIKPAHGGTHGYFPDFKEIQTGFIGYGPAFNKGEVIPVMGLEDIAPIVSELLQLNFKSPDGVLYLGILNKKEQPK
jgi:predicted AlkP superfamily pyrophosphatase or phosphodiesterase